MDVNAALIDQIRNRSTGQSFGYGITTADRYVEPTLRAIGAQNVDTTALVAKASRQLVYSGPNDVILKGSIASVREMLPPDVVIPDSALLVFSHVITTPREDRDTDILVTSGAVLDPKAPLLWQHMAHMPIGKVLAKIDHGADMLRAVSCLLDMNDLTRDAATLIAANVLRISHGFRALEYTPRKDTQLGPNDYPGFIISKFEIMEVSLVSVPSNVDAEIEMYSSGKLKSDTFKQHARYCMKQLTHATSPGADFNHSTPNEKQTPTRIHVVTKGFAVEHQRLESASVHCDWAAKWIECDLKSLCVTTTVVPYVRLGAFYLGLGHAIESWNMRDVRRLTDNGKELPPQREVIQLNSQSADVFLIEGTQFLERGDHRMCIQHEPAWGRQAVTIYADDMQRGQTLVNRANEWAAANNPLKGEAFSLTGSFLPRKDLAFDRVILPPEIKQRVERCVATINDKAADMPNRGLIFMGPPGTGKTLSGRIMMDQADATFIWMAARDFWHAGAVGGLVTAFELARELAPSVLFIEDVDNWLSERAIDVLKSEMDGIVESSGVATIITTNYPERLPDALIDRPGRFHDVLRFSLPDDKCRRDMLLQWTSGLSEPLIKQLTEDTAGLSGAHLFELVKFAHVLSSEDSIDMAEAMPIALHKIEEQRSLINAVQTDGSHFCPTRGSRSYEAFIAMRLGDRLADKRATPFVDTPVAEATRWDAAAAVKRLRAWAGVDNEDPSNDAWQKYGSGFARITGDGTKLGDYGYPHHDIEDDSLVVVRSAVSSAIGRLNGASAADFDSEAERRAIYSHLAKHYDAWDGEAPALQESAKPDAVTESGKSTAAGNPLRIKEGRVLSSRNAESIRSSAGSLRAIAAELDAIVAQAESSRRQEIDDVSETIVMRSMELVLHHSHELDKNTLTRFRTLIQSVITQREQDERVEFLRRAVGA